MGLFSGLFGKSKVDHASARSIGEQAMNTLSRILTQEEQKILFKGVDAFYTKTKMWPARGKGLSEIRNYFVLLAKYIQLHIKDSFQDKFNIDDSIKISHSTIILELVATLNSQKDNPNSEMAHMLADIVITQALATQSSYIIATNLTSFLEAERIKINKSMNLLEQNQKASAWEILMDS